MNNNYYLIPVYNKHTYLNEIQTSYILSVSYPGIYRLEEDKELMRNKPGVETRDYLDFSRRVSQVYDKAYIPEYLIVEEREGKYYELASNGLVTTDKLADLELHQVNSCIAKEYYINTNYPKKFTLLYDEYIFYKAGELRKEIEASKMTLKKEK